MSLIFERETHALIGACFQVYNALGCGFLEAVYHESLEIELGYRKVPFETQIPFIINYRDTALKSVYRADLVAFGVVLLELKAVSALTDDHRAQTLNYLSASSLRVGLLVNFGSAKGLQYERLLPRTKSASSLSASSAESVGNS